MTEEMRYERALGTLRQALAEKDPEDLRRITEIRDGVIARYQPVFSRPNIRKLDAQTFRDFLMYRNNRHWSGLQRMGPATTASITALRSALETLLDEDRPIADRFNELLPRGVAKVKKLGKAILTPVLLIAYPDRYGVWNGTSDAAMRELGLLPESSPSISIGSRYARINELLLRLSKNLDIDLWTLDVLWWARLKKSPKMGTVTPDDGAIDEPPADQRFGLERHLHEFLVQNWDKTELGRDWALIEEGGDVDGYGSEVATDVGNIDLLARHRKQPRLLVVELKRAQTSDDTVGQVMRYMGWVKAHMARHDDKVQGLIIGLEQDAKLCYALKVVEDIRFIRYEVSFRLKT